MVRPLELPTALPVPPARDLGPVRRRHLVYHLCPVRGRWRRCLDQIWRRLDLFDGSVTIAVAYDGEARGIPLDSPEEVRPWIPPGAVMLPVPHSAKLGEVASWVPLWEACLSKCNDGDAILYAHSKGVARPQEGIYRRWADALYALNLDHWPAVEKLLERLPIVGSFKKHSRAGFDDSSRTTWHYSGTFYWVRAGDFRRRPWRDVGQYWAGSEAWVGEAYHPRDGGCVFLEGGASLDLYSAKYWRDVVGPAYREFAAANPARPDPRAVPGPVYVVTPLTRAQNLQAIADSLGNLGPDVRWVVIPAGSPPTWGGPERVRALEAIPPAAWVYCCDDDTVIHPGLGAALRDAIASRPAAEAVVVGQVFADGSPRLETTNTPRLGTVDTGSVIFRRRAAEGLEWGPEYDADGRFYSRLFSRLSSDQVAVIPSPLSIYNGIPD